MKNPTIVDRVGEAISDNPRVALAGALTATAAAFMAGRASVQQPDCLPGTEVPGGLPGNTGAEVITQQPSWNPWGWLDAAKEWIGNLPQVGLPNLEFPVPQTNLEVTVSPLAWAIPPAAIFLAAYSKYIPAALGRVRENIYYQRHLSRGFVLSNTDQRKKYNELVRNYNRILERNNGYAKANRLTDSMIFDPQDDKLNEIYIFDNDLEYASVERTKYGRKRYVVKTYSQPATFGTSPSETARTNGGFRPAEEIVGGVTSIRSSESGSGSMGHYAQASHVASALCTCQACGTVHQRGSGNTSGTGGSSRK
jgi:hypothetical protein